MNSPGHYQRVVKPQKEANKKANEDFFDKWLEKFPHLSRYAKKINDHAFKFSLPGRPVVLFYLTTNKWCRGNVAMQGNAQDFINWYMKAL